MLKGWNRGEGGGGVGGGGGSVGVERGVEKGVKIFFLEERFTMLPFEPRGRWNGVSPQITLLPLSFSFSDST